MKNTNYDFRSWPLIGRRDLYFIIFHCQFFIYLSSRGIRLESVTCIDLPFGRRAKPSSLLSRFRSWPLIGKRDLN
jgi:hypothetical protein